MTTASKPQKKDTNSHMSYHHKRGDSCPRMYTGREFADKFLWKKRVKEKPVCEWYTNGSFGAR